MCLSPKGYGVCTLRTHSVKPKAQSQRHGPAAVYVQRPDRWGQLLCNGIRNGFSVTDL